MLTGYGILVPERFKTSRWSGQFINWLEEIEMHRPSGKMALQIDIDELKRYRSQVATASRAIRKLAKTDLYKERVHNLLTIPGVGIITAMTLLQTSLNRSLTQIQFWTFCKLKYLTYNLHCFVSYCFCVQIKNEFVQFYNVPLVIY